MRRGGSIASQPLRLELMDRAIGAAQPVAEFAAERGEELDGDVGLVLAQRVEASEAQAEAVTSSSAITVAERGPRSRIASSPNTVPGAKVTRRMLPPSDSQIDAGAAARDEEQVGAGIAFLEDDLARLPLTRYEMQASRDLLGREIAQRRDALERHLGRGRRARGALASRLSSAHSMARSMSGSRRLLAPPSAAAVSPRPERPARACFLCASAASMSENLRAGRVDLGDAAKVEDDGAGRLRRLGVDDLREALAAAEEQRALQLDRENGAALHLQHQHLAGAARFSRTDAVAAVEPADVGAAHAEHEKEHGKRNAEEHRQHDVHRDREDRDEQRDAEIDRDDAALGCVALEQARP